MKQELKEFTKEDFLKNDFFIESQLNPSAISDAFWTDLLKQNKINKQAYTEAKNALLNLDIDGQLEIANNVTESVWKKIDKDVTPKARWRFKLVPMVAAASVAAILIFALTLYMQYNNINNQAITHSVSSDILEKHKNSEEVLLVLSDNEVHAAKDGSVVDYSSDNEIKVDDKTIATQSHKTTYNQLIVPYGKRTSVILADGSKIWLNAGSHMIYPTAFAKDKREIHISGEAYADISRDEKKPFKIRTDKMTVEVLGTRFNVNAYEGSTTQSIVLVEGSVAVRTQDNKRAVLKPNERYAQTNDTHRIDRVDVSNYISWVEGYYSFENEKLGVILQKLSDYYGVNITCDSQTYNLQCTGGLDLKDDLKRVLDGLSQSTPTEYTHDKETGKYIYKLKSKQ